MCLTQGCCSKSCAELYFASLRVVRDLTACWLSAVVAELLTFYKFPGDDIPIVRGSALAALEGRDPEIGRDAILKLMAAVDAYIPEPVRQLDKPFSMPIEDVFSIQGRGTVVTGRVEQGVVRTGEDVEIVGIKDKPMRTTITGVEMFKKTLDQGQAGDNVGLLMRGLKREDVQRGQVVCKPGSVQVARRFEAEIYILTKEEGGRHTAFFKNYRPQVRTRPGCRTYLLGALLPPAAALRNLQQGRPQKRALLPDAE